MRHVALAFLLAAFAARADIAPMAAGAAGSATPMTDAQSVSMASEDVTITLHDGFAVIDARFVMANSDRPATLNVGFPGEGVILPGPLYRAQRPLIGFTVYVNNARGASTTKSNTKSWTMGPPGRQYTKHHTDVWHTFPVTFASGERTVIRVVYAIIADPYHGGSWESHEWFEDGDVPYILSTGARWAGPIGKAVFRIRTADNIALPFVRVRDGHMPVLEKNTTGAPAAAPLPKYATRSDDAIVLRREAFEPGDRDNLEIVYTWVRKREWTIERADLERTTMAAAEAVARLTK